MTMWFDPTCEEPLLRKLPPPDSDELGQSCDGVQSELSPREEVVPLEGGAAKVSEEEESELPF